MSPLDWRDSEGCVLLQMLQGHVSAQQACNQVVTELELLVSKLHVDEACDIFWYELSQNHSHWPLQSGVNVVPALVMVGPTFCLWQGSAIEDGQKPQPKKRARHTKLDADPLVQAGKLLDAGGKTKTARKTAAAKSKPALQQPEAVNIDASSAAATATAQAAAGEVPADDDGALAELLEVFGNSDSDTDGSNASIESARATAAVAAPAQAEALAEEMSSSANEDSDSSASTDVEADLEAFMQEHAGASKHASVQASVSEPTARNPGAGDAEFAPPAPAASAAEASQPTESSKAPARHGARVPSVPDRDGTVVLQVGSYGEIRFLPQQKQLVASCYCLKHKDGDCRRTRTVVAAAQGRTAMQRGQGRPLGHLIEWLRQQSKFGSQQAHCHYFFPFLFRPTGGASVRSQLAWWPAVFIYLRETPQRG